MKGLARIEETGDRADSAHDGGRGTNTATTGITGLLGERKLTVPEAAKVLGMGTTSLRRLITEGRLPVLRMLTKILILESDLAAFLEDSRGTIAAVPAGRSGLPPLPAEVLESAHLGRGRKS